MVLLNDELIYLGFVSKICSKCKNQNPNSFDLDKHIIGTCKAFPKGIPDTIWIGKNNHKKPYKGDHGIQFEKV